MDFKELLEQRYTTKYYDSSRKVDEDTVTRILECTRLTPTSANSQPYHFYVLTGASKDNLRPAIKDFNMQRYDGASHAVVITCKSELDEDHLKAVLEAEIRDGRLPDAELVAAQDKSRHFFSNLHVEKGDYNAWTCKQAYIAFGTMVYAAAAYGVDSTALEGIDYEKCDEIMQLADRKEQTAVIVLLGYRSAKDSNTVDKRPKSRLSLEQLVTRLN
ncbi:nitroreductase family protein [Anaerobiospirillum sp. NML120449]|uniref:nitroreductase family protein n=1 Tax=Anaerobiospirillum sp. NML120449 TaxID=2932817 RepID=UPI001FF334B9|nr:nitroreductase family protein [Anaerobiospirillum sp. NML120449]MCK0526977.1 nitroreductase family protein [Anaerobiospirillum sp. NML120449]